MKKLVFVLIVSFLTVVLTTPASAAYIPSEGDLIKTENDSALYKIENGARKLFVNEVTFWSHYTGSWSNIKYNNIRVVVQTISQSGFDNLSTSGHITVKSGSKLITFESSPRNYVVYGGDKIKHFTDNEAKIAFGSNWTNKIITIQNGFESDYKRNNNDFIDSDNNGIDDNDDLTIYSLNTVSYKITELEDSQLYENLQYNYELEFPKNYVIGDETIKYNSLNTIVFEPATWPPIIPINISVYNNTSINKWIDQQIEILSEIDGSIYSQEDIIIDGKPAVKFLTNKAVRFNSNTINILIEYNNRLYIIYWNSSNDEDVFNQILNTLRIKINSNNWDEYNNSKYNFKFKYPTGWEVGDAVDYTGGVIPDVAYFKNDRSIVRILIWDDIVTNLKTWVDNYILYTVQIVEQIEVNRLPAITHYSEYVISNSGPYTFKNYFIKKDNRVFEITSNIISDSRADNFIEAMDNIISTLKID